MFIEDNIKTEPLSPEMCSGMINDYIKIEDEICTSGVTKVEISNKPLFCRNCQEYYQDYCTKCAMLVHILNGTTFSSADVRAQEKIPMDILEMRLVSGQFRIFALKTIPEGVRFGPFTGLSTLEWPRKVKGGRLMVCENKSKFLNWMRHINSARNISEQNLLVFQLFQCEDNIYYRSIREIQVGEELLVYFGKKYEDNRNKDIEMDFIAHIEPDMNDVFACTYCCLGFSSREYLAKHKRICLNGTTNRFSIKELRRCPVCHIYLGELEYLEYHMTNCWKKNDETCIPLAPDNETIDVRRERTKRRHLYKCKHCKYKTAYKGDLKCHANKHYEVKMYKCGICNRRFKMKEYLKIHVEKMHAEDARKEPRQYSRRGRKAHAKARYYSSRKKGKQFECFNCKFRTKYKSNLRYHIRTNHLKEFDHRCEMCEYKTNDRQTLEKHTRTKHLKEFNYECELCDYKTNYKPNLEIHVKSKHLKEFKYECDICQYSTNVKAYLGNHIRTNHLDEFRYKCDMCDFKTEQMTNLEIHIKTKHLKEFDYECGLCKFRTNNRSHLRDHTRTVHLKEFRYKCEICEYETNHKTNLKGHVKTKHLKEFKHKCQLCQFKTNHKSSLKMHVQTKHLKEFDYKCEMCELKTNTKGNLVMHVKTVHLQEFRYKCATCPYKTNRKEQLERHIISKHLKAFNYQCESCVYKTNYKRTLENHIRSKHLKEFDYACEICEFKTNAKRTLKLHIKVKHLQI